MIHRIANKTYNGHGLYRTDYNPLKLPPYTIRLKYKDGYEPTYTQAVPPSSHSLCFANCGGKVQTGSAELAQIPTSCGGKLAE